MTLQINCTRCGLPIDISDEQLDEARKLNVPLDVAHEVCPRDRENKPAYRVTVEIRRYPTYADAQTRSNGVTLSSAGSVLEAASFASAYGALTDLVNEQLAQAAPLATLAESGIEEEKE